ncbi:MAG: DUF507 family protein [Desulfobacterales bacterium]|nr:DUF507 family protein [Desulfobacterales bacterium]
MQPRDSGRVQDKLLKRLERQEKQQAFGHSRFFKFKLPEIHNRLSQKLVMEKIIETDNPAAISNSLLQGMKKALKTSEFDFKYFISPIRNLVAQPDPFALYICQYIMEILIKDPDVIDIYGTDEEIYAAVKDVISQSKTRFEQAEQEIAARLARNQSLRPGTGEYEVAFDQLLREKVGEPQK